MKALDKTYFQAELFLPFSTDPSSAELFGFQPAEDVLPWFERMIGATVRAFFRDALRPKYAYLMLNLLPQLITEDTNDVTSIISSDSALKDWAEFNKLDLLALQAFLNIVDADTVNKESVIACYSYAHIMRNIATSTSRSGEVLPSALPNLSGNAKSDYVGSPVHKILAAEFLMNKIFVANSQWELSRAKPLVPIESLGEILTPDFKEFLIEIKNA